MSWATLRCDPTPRGLWSLSRSSMALQVAAASWALPSWLVVMVGIEPVPRSVLTAAGDSMRTGTSRTCHALWLWAQEHRTGCS